MGKYINTLTDGNALPNSGKVQALLSNGATLTDNTFKPNLICVVDNGMFEAAAYAYSENEFNVFNNDRSGRPKTWLTHPHAEDLAKD